MAKRSRTKNAAPEKEVVGEEVSPALSDPWVVAGVVVFPEKIVEDPPSGAMEAFDQIADICGCRTWDYPGQLVRDVRALASERDELRLQRDIFKREAHLLRIERDILQAEVDRNAPPDVRAILLEAVRKNPGMSPADLVESLVRVGGPGRSKLRQELMTLIEKGKVAFTMERTLKSIGPSSLVE